MPPSSHEFIEVADFDCLNADKDNMILAGDIGGTNSRLAVFDDKLNLLHEQTLRNEGRSGIEDVFREFRENLPVRGKVDRACFGIAGPVKDGRASMTNLPWKLEEGPLSVVLGIEKVALINDLAAHAEGIELLKPEQLIAIQKGEPIRGSRAVIAAGTGLGEAGILWDERGCRYHAFPSEGGHADFAPRDDRQIALMKYIRSRYPNASWERVLSGPGLRNIYDFLITPDQLGPSAALPDSNPRPSQISDAGLAKSNRVCVEALAMFVAFYGAESANLALKLLATGGVFLGGGIAAKIAKELMNGAFLEAFVTTGPENIRAVLRAIPVSIINFELNGLFGAANHASKL